MLTPLCIQCFKRDNVVKKANARFNGTYLCQNDAVSNEKRKDYLDLKMLLKESKSSNKGVSAYPFMMFCGEFIKKYGGKALVAAIDQLDGREHLPDPPTGEVVDVAEEVKAIWPEANIVEPTS